MAGPKRLAAVKPTERNRERVNLASSFFRPATRIGMRPRYVIDVANRDNMPRTGPLLVLSNHVGFFDPAQLIIASRRNIHFMATQATMTDPILGRVMQLFGAVPKQKGMADPSAIQGLRRWTQLGQAVGLFPEGERTWDGNPLPILPGIERLVRLLRVPVVTARIENADHVTPRWASVPRRGRLRITFDAPYTFEKGTKLPVIREWVIERLSVDPAKATRWPVKGKYLARGLTNLLFACPRCHALEGLREDDEFVECRKCRGSWRVTADAHLEGLGERRPIYEVAPQVAEHARVEWSKTLDADPKARLLRSLDAVEVHQDVEGQHALVATGRLIIDGEGAHLRLGRSRPWSVALEEMGAWTVEVSRRLQLACKDGRLFEFTIPRESVLKFKSAGDLLVARHKR